MDCLRKRVALACCLASVLGCGAGQSSASPKHTTTTYGRALAQRDSQRAYALLSRDAQQRISLAEFERMLRENPGEVQEISQQLLAVSSNGTITATVTGPDGHSLLLRLEDGEWKVDGSVLDLYSQTTPRDALASFVRAFENGRYDILMRFVPSSQLGDMTAESLKASWEGDQKREIEKLTQALEVSLNALHIEILGSRATVGYGAGGTVELINEEGNWKIEDF